MAKALSRFTIERAPDGFLLSIEDEDGDTIDFTASPEQLDLVSEAVDEALSYDLDDAELDADDEDDPAVERDE